MICIELDSTEWPSMNHVAYLEGEPERRIVLEGYPKTAQDVASIRQRLTLAEAA